MKEPVHFMDDHFEDSEKVYRAVFPPEVADTFRKRDGSASTPLLSKSQRRYLARKAAICY